VEEEEEEEGREESGTRGGGKGFAFAARIAASRCVRDPELEEEEKEEHVERVDEEEDDEEGESITVESAVEVDGGGFRVVAVVRIPPVS